MTHRILHFGVGNFCRAHIADYTQDAGQWAMTGVSLRSPAVRDGLSAQNFDYTLSVQEVANKQITVFDRILVATEAPDAVLAAVSAPDVHMISLTVTEKGYHLTNDGHLDLQDPLIKSDLAGQGPRTAIGFLARGLANRTEPVTVLSCDNRNGNGDALFNAVKEFVDQAGIKVDWSNVSFPNSMVDRITPATTDDLRESTGDEMAVLTEAFREWVIEDSFCGPRPNWPDVQFVADVAPHEMRKLRMLNGAHSALAYAGLLAGHAYVHEAIKDPDLRALAKAIMAEAAVTLPDDIRAMAPDYADALIKRFENPSLAHSLRQIAMDGTQKLPYRMIDSLRARLALNLRSPALTAAIRAWVAFCQSEVTAERPLQDPKSDDIMKAARSSQSNLALLSLIGASDLFDAVFGDPTD